MEFKTGSISEYLNLAVKASILAGKEIMSVYEKSDFGEKTKDDTSPLTLADENAHNIITKVLKKSNIPILSEEGKQLPYSIRKKWNELWIVDPLDGTKEFIKRNGEFTVNIALVIKGKPLLGVIYVPVTNNIYIGDNTIHKAYKTIIDKDFCNNYVYRDEDMIKPTTPNDKSILRIVGSRSHMNSATEQFIKSLDQETTILSIGSSLKFCLVAEGKADIYPRFAPTMEWDTAAGQAICEAVGLKVISLETNEPLLYNKEKLLNPYFKVITHE